MSEDEEQMGSKVHFLLDSGANETMMKSKEWATRTWASRTQIKTANPAQNIDASTMGEVPMTNDQGTRMPGLKEVIFTPHLRENLMSVGKLTDEGYTVIFNACGVKIYKNRGLRVSGREVHYEARNSHGLYPLTLTPTIDDTKNAPPRDVQARFTSTARQILSNTRKERESRVTTDSKPSATLPDVAQIETLSSLARVYPREDMSVLEKWHSRCAHASVKTLKELGISELQGKRIPLKYRCDACIKGKIHRMSHKEMHDLAKPTYEPGQCLATDLMGPYANSIEGSKYAQLFKCPVSKYRWLCTLTSKDQTLRAIEVVLIDCKARSGNSLKFLKTDGDGIFRSTKFEELRTRYGFIHEWAAPHDHNSNTAIERDIRTVFEGAATALQASGASSRFWADAMHHFIFTRNVLPFPTKNEKGQKVNLSPQQRLNPQAAPFNLEYLVAFGTKCTCYVPETRRDTGKQPSQKKAFEGMIIGYVRDMPAYRVYDLESRKRCFFYNDLHS